MLFDFLRGAELKANKFVKGFKGPAANSFRTNQKGVRPALAILSAPKPDQEGKSLLRAGDFMRARRSARSNAVQR